MEPDGLAATLQLPRGVRIHPTVHVDQLKKFHGRMTAVGVPIDVNAEEFDVEDEHADDEERQAEELEIATIIAVRNVERVRPPHDVIRQEYLVAWKGREDEDNTWLSKSALQKDKHRAQFLEESGYLDEEPPVRKAR